MNNLAKIDVTAAKIANDAGLSGEAGNITQTCPAVQLEIGVFFDGTLNNRFNVISKAREDASYQNALSNPALLWARYKNDSRYDEANACGGTARAFRSVYVEGPGSTRYEEDDTPGFAFGMGRQSGVESRVFWAFRRVLREIYFSGGAPNISKLVLDVFGFSRGAAGARYFVNCIRAREINYDPLGPGDYTEKLPEGLEVEIRFVGIFDTVAAIGKPDDDDNDPVNVHLKTDQVKGQILHLTAGEEYRRNFRLNRNVPGGGNTLELPGAHSDVGGGYRDPEDLAPLTPAITRKYHSLEVAQRAREDLVNSVRAKRSIETFEAVFIEEGWLTGTETDGGVVHEVSQPQLSEGSTNIYVVVEQFFLKRPWVKVGLSRVALHIMYDAAVMKVNGAFLDLPENDDNYLIPPELHPYEDAIRSGGLTGIRRHKVLREFGHVSMKEGALGSADWMGYRPEGNHVRVEYPNKPGKAV